MLKKQLDKPNPIRAGGTLVVLVKAARLKGGSWRRCSCSQLDGSLRGLKLFCRIIMLRGRPMGKQLARRPHRDAVAGRMVLSDHRPGRRFVGNLCPRIAFRSANGCVVTDAMLISCGSAVGSGAWPSAKPLVGQDAADGFDP